jgi:hypothetical protein
LLIKIVFVFYFIGFWVNKCTICKNKISQIFFFKWK